MNKHIKLLAVSAASTLLLATTAGADFVYSKIIQEVVQVKDSDGNEYEVTHSIERENLTVIDYYQGVPMEIINETPDEFVGLNIAYSSSDSWGDNLLEKIGEGVTIPSGEHNYLTFNYDTTNTLIDIRFIPAEGEPIPFEQVDLASLEGATHCTMTFTYDEEEQSYSVSLGV